MSAYTTLGQRYGVGTGPDVDAKIQRAANFLGPTPTWSARSAVGPTGFCTIFMSPWTFYRPCKGAGDATTVRHSRVFCTEPARPGGQNCQSRTPATSWRCTYSDRRMTHTPTFALSTRRVPPRRRTLLLEQIKHPDRIASGYPGWPGAGVPHPSAERRAVRF